MIQPSVAPCGIKCTTIKVIAKEYAIFKDQTPTLIAGVYVYPFSSKRLDIRSDIGFYAVNTPAFNALIDSTSYGKEH